MEFASFGNFTAPELAKFLTAIGLKSIGSHVGIEELRNHLDDVIEFQRTIGSRYVVCPSMPKEFYDTPEHLFETATFFNEVGQKLTSHGLIFGYHNHSFEFTNFLGNTTVYDELFSRTSGRFVRAELDVCWTQYGGQNPIESIRKYINRIPLIHLKDLQVEAGEPVTVALGEGEMELNSIIEESARAGADWLIVEQDNVQYDVFDSVFNSIRWLKENY